MNPDDVRQLLPALDFESAPAVAPLVSEYLRYYGIDFAGEFPRVTHRIGTLVSGEFTLLCHYYDVADASAACVMIHGYFDHSGLCRHYIRYYLERGISVVVFDLPGHGLSSGASASIDDFAHYRKALVSVIGAFASVLPAHRILMGQSTGGAIVMDYLLTQKQADFQAVILFAPLVRPHLWWLSQISLFIFGPFLRSIPRAFANNSNDPDFLHFLKYDDPLQSQRLPTRWAKALQRWIAQFQGYKTYGRPILVVQGNADITVDWRYNLGHIKRHFPAVDIHMIDGARHHLLGESTEFRTVIQSMLDRYLTAQGVDLGYKIHNNEA